MELSVELIPGPLTNEMTRDLAERGLRNHPAIRKGSSYALEQMDGRWVAAVVHTAGPPPFAGGGPADADEGAPGPKSEGPDDTEPSEGPDAGGDKPPFGGESEGGESGGHEKKEHGDEHGEISQVVQMLQQVMEALGIPMDLGGDPMGAGDPSAPPPPGPPGPPGMHGGPNEQHIIHERVTKPGDTPPGGTPLGAPAFASVKSDHPWAHVLGKVASFQVEEKIGDAPIHKVAEELEALVQDTGYRYQLREGTNDDGDRVAIALITQH